MRHFNYYRRVLNKPISAYDGVCLLDSLRNSPVCTGSAFSVASAARFRCHKNEQKVFGLFCPLNTVYVCLPLFTSV